MTFVGLEHLLWASGFAEVVWVTGVVLVCEREVLKLLQWGYMMRG